MTKAVNLATVGSNATSTGTTLTAGTAQASTSGTNIDFTSIPSWVKRITVMFNGVSTNGTSNYLIQIGPSGGVETSGYVGNMARQAAASNSYNAFSNGIVLTNGMLATEVFYGNVVLTLQNSSTNTWTITGQLTGTGTGNFMNIAGVKALAGALSIVRVTSATPDTFDAGSINILWE